jgi:DNA-binding MarR family transcriptional regulator
LPRRPKRRPGKSPIRIDPDTVDFYEAFQEVLRLYQFRDRDRSASCGLSLNQCYALESIDRLGPLTVNELATRLALDKSSASRIVSSLERSGLVRRSTLASDARVLQIETTPAGAELHASIRRGLMEGQQKLLADLEPRVRQAMTRFLRRLARARTGIDNPPA